MSRQQWLQVSSMSAYHSIVNKGRSHKLLRKYLLRKEKEKKISDAEIVKQDLDSIPNLMNEITDLKNEIMLRDAQIDRLEEDRTILKDLFEKGVIDEEGNLL